MKMIYSVLRRWILPSQYKIDHFQFNPSFCIEMTSHTQTATARAPSEKEGAIYNLSIARGNI